MCTLVYFLQYPDHPYGDLYDKILLYKHDIANALVPLDEGDTIDDGTVIEIILTSKRLY